MIPQEFFGVGWAELALLLIAGVVLFGPEKLPVYARKAARVVAWARAFADNATNQLKAELGPEYQDLTAADLNPKTFVTKHLLAEVQADLDDVKTELNGVKSDLGLGVSAVSSAGAEVKSTLTSATKGSPALTAAELPWDDEAT